MVRGKRRQKERMAKPSRSGLESLNHERRYSQNVEVGMFFAFKHVEEVKRRICWFVLSWVVDGWVVGFSLNLGALSSQLPLASKAHHPEKKRMH